RSRASRRASLRRPRPFRISPRPPFDRALTWSALSHTGGFMADLKDCIAVVTGATRGAGRGVAMELGAAGATVYVTGRSTRAQPAATYEQILAWSKLPAVPGSIEDTADEVTRAGGRGIPVRCDHTREDEV